MNDTKSYCDTGYCQIAETTDYVKKLEVQLSECEARLRKAVGILRDMAYIAELDRWNRALTGREMILRDARTVLAEIEKGN